MTAPKHIWTKFFWSNYASDAALQVCSFAAQGLWMRMLCIAAQHDPIGYVAVENRGLDESAIARATGGQLEEVRELIGELERNGVFSRDRRGVIYSRRMINDARKAAEGRKFGKLGGNPKLSKQRENSGTLKGAHKSREKPPDKTKKIEARSQSESSSHELSPGGWQGPSEIWDAVVNERDRNFAGSYLARSTWLGNGKLKPWSGRAMVELARLDCLAQLGVVLILAEGENAA